MGKLGWSVAPEVHLEEGKRINDELSAFTGELVVILYILKWVEEYKPQRMVIASDSSSSLISIKRMDSDARPDVVGRFKQCIESEGHGWWWSLSGSQHIQYCTV